MKSEPTLFLVTQGAVQHVRGVCVLACMCCESHPLSTPLLYRMHGPSHSSLWCRHGPRGSVNTLPSGFISYRCCRHCVSTVWTLNNTCQVHGSQGLESGAEGAGRGAHFQEAFAFFRRMPVSLAHDLLSSKPAIGISLFFRSVPLVDNS